MPGFGLNADAIIDNLVWLERCLRCGSKLLSYDGGQLFHVVGSVSGLAPLSRPRLRE
jgi:hypothetical protein